MVRPQTPRSEMVPAVVLAGDRRASRAIYGESKVYLEIEDHPLVARVVEVLQRVPEVDQVWVVGDAKRLEAVLGSAPVQRQLRKPLHIVAQFRNLYENGWQTFRRLLPGAGPDGRDPEPQELDQPVLYLSADLPFATPQEISAFVRQSLARGCDYTVGLAREESLRAFYPAKPGEPGIRMAYFNLREGRFRQTNLNLIRPARIGNRHYVEELYEHRYQKQFGNFLALAWRLLGSEAGGLRVLGEYLLMHLAGVADRRGWRRVSDFLRRRIPIARIEARLGLLLRGSFGFITTEAGGCAIDIDCERDLDAARACFTRWRGEQTARAEALYGPLPLPAEASPADRPAGTNGR